MRPTIEIHAPMVDRPILFRTETAIPTIRKSKAEQSVRPAIQTTKMNIDIIIESILTLIAHIIVISALLAVPAVVALVLYFVLPKKRRVRRRIAACVFTVLSAAVFITAAVFYQYPPIIVPDELARYITDEDINTAPWLRNGFYARRVPCFSLYIEFD